jgi:hypothetical protein
MRKTLRSEKLLIKLAIKRKELMKTTKSSRLTLITVERITRVLITALKVKQVIAIRFQVNILNNLQVWGKSCHVMS